MIVFLIIIIVIVIYIYNINQENFTNTQTANEALQNMSSLYNNQNMTLSNLTTTGTIKSTGVITSNSSIISSGPTGGLGFYDREGGPQWIWYGSNNTANLWNGSSNALTINTNGDIKAGNYSTAGTINTGTINTNTLIVNNGLWQPDYFRFQCFCNSSNCYYASDANTLASGNLNTYTDDSAKWYLMGYRIINKKYGTCITDPNNGNNSANFILKPYDPNNKFQMFSKHHSGGNGYRIWGIGSGNWVGGWQDTTPLRRYFGSNGGDCNFGFVDIF